MDVEATRSSLLCIGIVHATIYLQTLRLLQPAGTAQVIAVDTALMFVVHRIPRLLRSGFPLSVTMSSSSAV